MKHKGLHAYRLKKSAGNPQEVIFATRWQKHNDLNNTLKYLLGDGKDPAPDMSVRDTAVAATVVQWFGSQVGMWFLLRAIAERPEYAREFIRNMVVANPAIGPITWDH